MTYETPLDAAEAFLGDLRKLLTKWNAGIYPKDQYSLIIDLNTGLEVPVGSEFMTFQIDYMHCKEETEIMSVSYYPYPKEMES